MLQKEQLEKYIELCMDSQADFAEIFEERTVQESINTLNGRVELINSSVKCGIGIRLYKGVQSFYAYSNDSSEASVLPLIEDLRSAVGEAEDGAAKPAVPLTRVEYENLHPVRIDFEAAPLPERISILERADAAAKAVDNRIVKFICRMLNLKQKVQISNSSGRLISDTRVRTRIMGQAFAEENGNVQSGSDSPGAGMGLEFYETTTPESVGREAAREALVNLSAKDCPSGKMPVIIDNAFGGVIFHEACGHALEASAVSRNQSVFSGKLGQQIAAACVSAVDDGTIPNAWGSENIDDEGNFQQRRQLIKDGILISYMADRLNGRRMGTESTGSGRRQSYEFEPSSRMSNTFILQGNASFEELFEGIERGVYAKKMGGGSVDPQTGEFNFAVNEGYIIENGKIGHPLKGAALIGNGRDILMNIDRVCSDLKRGQGMCGAESGSVPTDVGQPAIRVSSITVGGTANE